jgi:hypothetical protein
MLRDIAWLSAGAPMDYANFTRIIHQGGRA